MKAAWTLDQARVVRDSGGTQPADISTGVSPFSRVRVNLFRARILKHLLEAEKSTFREELSFQRSESTIGLLQATVFYIYI